MRRLLAAAIAALVIVLAGCGGASHSGPSHPAGTAVAVPESARTPEGARPASPPPLLFRLGPGAKHISTAGLHLIEQFEGYSRCAYWDPYGRVWTAGFGQTRGIYGGFCFSGLAAAEANLRASVESEYEWALRGLGVSLNQHQWDALCSFAYNLGAGIFTGQLRADLQSRQFYAASRIMLLYDHAGGQVLEGLRTRRILEVRLMLAPVAETAAQRHARLQRQLWQDYRYRSELRRDLVRHQCRTVHGTHAYRACPRWGAEGRTVNRQITALERGLRG